ncbi:MAG TPA: hypothetical protein VFN37_13270 [Candidatus Baltobacteraceae bacterium]|nr:hypothetical protein [Candidatus Baltobacteraceae bacterium]
MTAPPGGPFMDLQQLVLMPETQARRALRGRGLRLRVLAPVGAYAGRGSLRVLRAKPLGDAGDIELVCGYEAYERLISQ